MYAIIKTGGKQYRVSVGDKLKVETLAVEAGAQVTLIRPEMKFDSIEALKSQMSADINYTINYAGSHTF